MDMEDGEGGEWVDELKKGAEGGGIMHLEEGEGVDSVDGVGLKVELEIVGWLDCTV